MTLPPAPVPPNPESPKPALDFAWLALIATAPQPDHSHCDQLNCPFSELPMCQ